MSELTEAAIKKLKVNELKAELSKRGLAVKGKKDELVKRLLEALEEDDGSEESAASSEEEEPTEADVQDAAVDTSQEEEPTPEEIKPEETPAPVEESDIVDDESKVPDSSGDAESVDEPISSDDYVIVKKPSDDVAKDVEKGAIAQDATIEEQEVTEGKGVSESPMEVTESPMEVTESHADDVPKSSMEVSESPMEVSESVKVLKSPKKSPKKDVVTSSEKVSPDGSTKESPRKSRLEKEKSSEESAKNGEREKDLKKEPIKEVKKEPEIIDVLAEVVEEEGEIPEEFVVAEGAVVLDAYLSDINFIISNNGNTGHNLVKNGFSYMWAGARANKGAKGGKIGYELQVVSLSKGDLPESEAPVNAVRIGWSSENSNLQLGESSLSYGFESTGKVCASSSFFDYGEKFTEGDVIGTYLDLESEPKTLRYTKNGEDLGVAMSLTVNLEEKPLFPHIFLRNMKVVLNFGGNDEPWFPTLEGYSLIQNAAAENIADKTSEPPTEFADCEVYLLVGLPNSGKTLWVKKYVESHPKEHFNVIGVKYVMERCKLEGKHRKKSDPNTEKLMKAVIMILTKLYHLCPKRKRHFIFDQNNIYKVAQETKMALFEGFQRKAVVIVPTHDNLRRRTSDSKRRGDNIAEIPFGDLCDMKCEFNTPEVGDFFQEVIYPELDEKNAVKTIRDYRSDGSRAKRTGRDEYPGSKKKRYDDRSSGGGKQENRFSGGARDSSRRDEGWKSSGSGFGGYDSNKGRSYYSSSYGGSAAGGYKRQDKPSYNDRRSSSGSGGGYRQQAAYGGNSYGSNTSGGHRGGSNYSSSHYGSSGGSYSSNNSYNSQSNRGSTGWSGQYGSNNQNSQSSQPWGSGSGNWSNYNYNNSGSNYGGSGGGYGY